MRRVEIAPAFDDWRRAARMLLREGVRPDEATWIETDRTSLIDEPEAGPAPFAVPRRFVDLAREVATEADPGRWALLYRLLWRIVHENHDLLALTTDPDVARALALEQHLAAPVRQPPVKITTELTATTETHFGNHHRRPAPLTDLLGRPLEAEHSAAAFVPLTRTFSALRDAAARCTACPLYENATQTVFGAGPADARAMFVGEQPGDQEDLQGLPFVGPAGDVLTRALAEAGIPRTTVYITNVVKHFKWEPRGKRRIHLTPRQPELDACRPWIEAEVDMLKPAVLVCLGATAAQALMGSQVRITRDRGRVYHTRWAPWTMATIHPSAILRMETPAAEAQAYADFVADLRKVAARLAEESP